jgi:LPPG:FO 2-phospho-L-lactate transferase
VRTPEGWLEFQEYFVHRGQQPEVLEVRFRGIDGACVTPEARAAIDAADVIVIAPSNPIVSTGPILALPGVREALGGAARRGTPIVAVSGIVGGRALRGPADRMLATLGHEPTALGVARIYQGVAGRFVLDRVDEALASDVEALGMRTLVTDTIMTDDAARARLAAEVLAFAVAP